MEVLIFFVAEVAIKSNMLVWRMTVKRNVKSIYLGGRCWEWLGRLCERRGGDTRYPGREVGSGRGQQPASGKSESGNRYTWTHCHATAPDYMSFRGKSTCDDVEKRAFYNIKVSVSVVGGFNASQIVDEGQRSSSGWGKPQLYRALHHLIIKMLNRFALTGALWSWDLCKSPILFFMIHILTTKLSWNRRYTYMIILLFL